MLVFKFKQIKANICIKLYIDIDVIMMNERLPGGTLVPGFKLINYYIYLV